MNRAGTVVILALVGAVLRMLCCRVAILPDVTISVAGLVFITDLIAVGGFAWWVIRRARRDGGLFRCVWLGNEAE